MAGSRVAAAASLAAEYAPDLAPDDEVDNEIEIKWDTTPILIPGIDYQEGVVYVTLPMTGNVPKTTGRGKAAVTSKSEQLITICVTSERRVFVFDPDHVGKQGFRFPRVFIQTETANWSPAAARAYTEKRDKPMDAFELFTKIRKVYETYVEFADEIYYDLVTLFVMSTYMFRLYSATGYLHFNGTQSSGKSQNLRLLKALAFNCIWASNMSVAALYRTIAGMPGTICMDEAEGFEGERGEELRRVLNAGYLEGETVNRMEKEGETFQVMQYQAYSPKVLASINPLDNVLASRCIIIAMRPAIRRIAEFDHRDAEWSDLRDQLYLWSMYHTRPMEDVCIEWNTAKRNTHAPKLLNRQWQIAQQYITLADYLGGDMMSKPMIEFFNKYFASQQQSMDATDRVRLGLRCLPRVLADKVPWGDNFYSVKDIHDVIGSYLDEDQREYYKTRTVTKHLDVLGFKNKRARSGGTHIQIVEDDVREAFKQRHVEPFDADLDWLAGKIDYQTGVSAQPEPDVPVTAPTFGWGSAEEPSEYDSTEDHLDPD